jgi:hypothetical protein
MFAIPKAHSWQNARRRRNLKCVAVSELRVAQSTPLVMQSVQAIGSGRSFSPGGNNVVFSNLLDVVEQSNGL